MGDQDRPDAGEMSFNAHYATLICARCNPTRFQRAASAFAKFDLKWLVAASKSRTYALVVANEHPELLVDLVATLHYALPEVWGVMGATLTTSAHDLDATLSYAVVVAKKRGLFRHPRAASEIRGIGRWHAAAIVPDGALAVPRGWRLRDRIRRVSYTGPSGTHHVSTRPAAGRSRYDAVAAQIVEVRRSYPTHLRTQLWRLEAQAGAFNTVESRLPDPAKSVLPADWLSAMQMNERVRQHAVGIRELVAMSRRGLLAIPNRTTFRALAEAAGSHLIPLSEIKEVGRGFASLQALLTYDIIGMALAEADAYCATLLVAYQPLRAAPPLRGTVVSGLARSTPTLSLPAFGVPFQSLLVALGHRTGMSWRPFLMENEPVRAFVAHVFSFSSLRVLDSTSVDPVVETDFAIGDAIAAAADYMWLASRIADRPSWNKGRWSDDWARDAGRSFVYKLPTYFAFRLGGAPLLAQGAAKVLLYESPRHAVSRLLIALRSHLKELWPAEFEAVEREGRVLARGRAEFSKKRLGHDETDTTRFFVRERLALRQREEELSCLNLCIAMDLIATQIAGPAYVYALARFSLGRLSETASYSWGLIRPDAPRPSSWPLPIRLSVCLGALEASGFGPIELSDLLPLQPTPIPKQLLMLIDRLGARRFTPGEWEASREGIYGELSGGKVVDEDPIRVMNALWWAVAERRPYLNEVALAESLIRSLTSFLDHPRRQDEYWDTFPEYHPFHDPWGPPMQ